MSEPSTTEAPRVYVYYAHISDIHATERWPTPTGAVDVRYQRYTEPFDPAALTAQYAPRYLHLPALGAQGCANGEGGGAMTMMDWASGLAAVQAAYSADLDLVVFCDCLEVGGRAHRVGTAIRLAQATGRLFAGALPLETIAPGAMQPGDISSQAG